VSDETDSLILRLLQEMRSATKAGLDAARADTGDLRRDVSEGFASMTGALTALGRQVADTRAQTAQDILSLDNHLANMKGQIAELTGVVRDTRADVQSLAGRLDAERITTLEARLADIERRLSKQ
jgi:chromosome segregation ATPase